MNHVARLRAVMNFETVDRLPVWEWAMWWDLTIRRWKSEGLPAHLYTVPEISEYFGLDPYQQIWFSAIDPAIEAVPRQLIGQINDLDGYRQLRPWLFPDHTRSIESMRAWAPRQTAGELVVWITLEGFFWFPRTLMDFTNLSLAFYDQPELLHQMNQDLLKFNLRVLEQVCRVCPPTFATVAEDMSYNHGPMISEQHFNEFLAPYYRQLVPRLLEHHIIPIVDTDGDVSLMIPWLLREGIRGVLPLERQAGVDGIQLRQQFPNLAMIGHFDKMVMSQGETALRQEFERLLPLMRAGGFIPSVDHQTPPGVSLAQYRLYLQLLREYVT